jgi:hypothetical protein
MSIAEVSSIKGDAIRASVPNIWWNKRLAIPVMTARRTTQTMGLAIFLMARNLHAMKFNTTFPVAENPISQGNSWFNGEDTGLDWCNGEAWSHM